MVAAPVMRTVPVAAMVPPAAVMPAAMTVPVAAVVPAVPHGDDGGIGRRLGGRDRQRRGLRTARRTREAEARTEEEGDGGFSQGRS